MPPKPVPVAPKAPAAAAAPPAPKAPVFEFETKRGLLVALERPTIVISLLKATAQTAPLVVQQLQGEKTSPQEIVQRFFVGFVISETIATSKAGLQHVAVEHLPSEVAVKLHRNPSRVATRAFEKNDHSRLWAAYEVAWSAPLAVLFNHLSIFVVMEAIEVFNYFAAAPPQKAEAAKQLRKRTARHFNLMASAVVFGSIGHTVGTLIQPGVGTYIVGTVAEAIPYLM